MIKISPEELVEYLYNETSEQKSAVIQAALKTDWNLRKTFEKLVSAQTNLNDIKFSPRPETIDSIVKYASKKRASAASH